MGRAYPPCMCAHWDIIYSLHRRKNMMMILKFQSEKCIQFNAEVSVLRVDILFRNFSFGHFGL